MFRKLRSLFVVYLKEIVAYPIAGFLWILADVQTALILPAVWLSAGSLQGLGLSPAQLVGYYLVSMTVSQFVTCHMMWDMAQDIMDGRFSAMEVRPVDHFLSQVVRNLAWRISKLALFAPLLLVTLAAYSAYPRPELHFSWQFGVAILMAQSLSFCAAYSLSMLTFWTTEFQSIFLLFYFPELLLSGRIVPLSSLPPWLRQVSDWTHFKYTIAFPTDLALGRTDKFLMGLAIQLVYCLAFFGLGRLLFHRGTRHYSGVGM